MSIRTMQYSFGAGEVSPEFEGRVEHQKYFAALHECLNFVTRPKGGIQRRFGTRFVNEAKTLGKKIRLLPFEFSITQAYVLELGEQYIRFYKNGARLENPVGTPVEMISPYLEAELFALQTAQSADVMWIVHPNHAPRKLQRFSDTLWRLDVIDFLPPPSTEEDDDLNVALTISGTTVTAASALWLDADVGRHILITDPALASQARAVITAISTVAPATAATINVLSGTFPASLAAGQWKISGSPRAGLRVFADSSRGGGKTGPTGTAAFLDLILRDIVAPELVTNGNFASLLTGWTNHSIAVMEAGTTTGATSPTILQDSAIDFISRGVRPAMIAVNVTDSATVKITALGNSRSELITESLASNWTLGDSYRIENTGAAAVLDGAAQLVGGPAGVGWIEQGVTTVALRTYRVVFDVTEGPISAQVGSASKGVDRFPEATFQIGPSREIIFIAVGTTTFIQFRNNQPTPARVDNVSVKQMSAQGFRSTDVGKFVKVNKGVVQITSLESAYGANGHLLTELDSTAESPAGAWTLEVAAWSSARGFPRAISFHQQRLGFAGTAMQPLTVWQSEVGAYEQFGASSLADASLEQEFSANKMNVLLWMEPFRDMLVGTAAGEHLLRGVNGPLTPSNGEQLPQTSVGSDGLPPLRIDNALLLLQRGARQIKELNYDENGAVVRGKDQTLLADHITQGGVTQWAVQQRPLAIIWGVRGDGVRIGLTYEQFEQVQGWHRHTTDGLYESVCVVPVNAPTNEHTEEVYVAVNRTIQGVARRYLERLDPTLQLDSALSYSGAATTILSGLSHLEGKTVQVVDQSSGQAAVLLPRVVSGGRITLERAVTKADVGLGYTSRAVTVRPEVPLRDGTLQGRKKHWVKIIARLLNTVGLSINGKIIPFRTPADAMDEGLTPRTLDISTTGMTWDTDGRITIEQTQPLPCTVLAVGGDLDVEEL